MGGVLLLFVKPGFEGNQLGFIETALGEDAVVVGGLRLEAFEGYMVISQWFTMVVAGFEREEGGWQKTAEEKNEVLNQRGAVGGKDDAAQIGAGAVPGEGEGVFFLVGQLDAKRGRGGLGKKNRGFKEEIRDEEKTEKNEKIFKLGSEETFDFGQAHSIINHTNGIS